MDEVELLDVCGCCTTVCGCSVWVVGCSFVDEEEDEVWPSTAREGAVGASTATAIGVDC